MAHINRFASSSGTYATVMKLAQARKQMEDTFPDDGRREIPQVLAVFEAIETTISKARILGELFEGPGSQTVADYLPDDTGSPVNDPQKEG